MQGTWRLYDTHLYIEAKWPDCHWNSADAKSWESRYINKVLTPILMILNDLGYDIQQQEYIFNDPQNRYIRKGDLRADVLQSGGRIEVNFFQNVNAPRRPDNAGRYESNILELMPYLMRLEMFRTINRITAFLESQFNFSCTTKRYELKNVRPGDLTALQYIEARYKECQHFNGDEDAIKAISPYNREDADKNQLVHGGRVWFYDNKGRLKTGIAYYNINSMWWVITGRYDWTNKAGFQLHTNNPGQPRVKRNLYLRKRRLSQVAFNALSAGNEALSQKLNLLIEKEFGDIGLLITRDQARDYFAICGLSYKQINKGQFDQLRKLVNDKLTDSGRMNGTLKVNRKTRYVSHGVGIVEAYIGCKAYYFSDRDAITFNASGNITFASWADDLNVQPVLEAFIQWCNGIKHETTRRKKLSSHV